MSDRNAPTDPATPATATTGRATIHGAAPDSTTPHSATPPPAAPLDRDTLIARLRAHVATRPAIQAAWLGGSDASHRLDAWSDVDLVVMADDDAVEAELLAVVELVSPAIGSTRFEQPTPHGHEQIVLRPAGAPDHLLLDVVVMAASTPPERRLLEPTRHGRPVVLLDRGDHLRSLPEVDRAAHETHRRRRLAELRDRVPLFATLITRAVERGHRAEAAARYLSMLYLPTIELARHLHCPERFDFGPRYLDRDLPEDLRREFDRLAAWSDDAGLRGCIADALALFHRLDAALQAAPDDRPSPAITAPPA